VNQEQAFPLSLLLMLFGVRLEVYALTLDMLALSALCSTPSLEYSLMHSRPTRCRQDAPGSVARAAGALEKGNHLTLRCAHARFTVHAWYCETCFIPS
jgi:hypothetical protein